MIRQGPTRPGRAGLGGAPRFVVYLALQFALFMSPLRWLAVPAVVVAALGIVDGLAWGRWMAGSKALLLVAALPAAIGAPWGALLDGGQLRGAIDGAVLSSLAAGWEPSLLRSARLALVLASAAWLSHGMSPVGLRDALMILLRPLGRRASLRASRAASLTMAFIPWTRAELRTADEAARLRGSNPAVRPGRHLAALSVPLVARSLEKAKRGSEALSLRDPGFGG